jgi:ABC-type molybdate transport system permease subunit
MKTANRKLITYFMAFMLALGSLSISTSASAGETYNFNSKPSAGDMLLDMVFMRPIMLVGTVVGTAVFVVTSPFSALGGNIGEAAETLVVEPAQYTFVRPLGEN